ncbi:hypothetical protein QAD02_019203, partial [Eretmocerus hayati]
QSNIDDRLRSFLEDLKSMLRTGNETLGIPVLDPFEMKYKNIDVNDHDLSMTGELSNTRIYGLSDYTINNATFKLAGLRIFLNLTWPKMSIETLYNIEAKFSKSNDLTFFGSGDVKSKIFSLTFTAGAKLRVMSQKVSIKDLSTGISMKNLQ